MIFVGGRVYAPDHPGATAVVTDGDLISFVGSDAAARRAAREQTEVDLRGRLLTPAFVDAHVHLIHTGQVMAGLGLHDVRSRDDAVERVAAYARHHPNAHVIIGHGWDERAWPEPLPPTRTELDRAAGGVAVYLARVDVHSAVVSSTLLDQLPGVSEAIGYRADGLLTREAHHLCRGSLDRLFTDQQRRSAARTALHAAAAQGVATVHELSGPHLGPIEDLTRVREVAAELGMGVASYWGELATEPTIEWAQQAGVAGLAGDLCIDGAIGSRTASLREPYADAETCGARYLSEQQIADHVIACTQAGLQAGFHCIGDDAVAAAVSGLRRAAATLGIRRIRAARHRLEHVEMISDADIATLAELGVVASMQPAFDAAWGKPGELYEQRLGPQPRPCNEPIGHSGALRRTPRVRHGLPSDPARRLGHRTGRGAALAAERTHGALPPRSMPQLEARTGRLSPTTPAPSGSGLWPALRFGTSQTTVWKGPRRCLGWIRARSRRVRRPSPLGGSSIDPAAELSNLGRLGPCPGPSRH